MTSVKFIFHFIMFNFLYNCKQLLKISIKTDSDQEKQNKMVMKKYIHTVFNTFSILFSSIQNIEFVSKIQFLSEYYWGLCLKKYNSQATVLDTKEKTFHNTKQQEELQGYKRNQLSTFIHLYCAKPVYLYQWINTHKTRRI